MACASAQEAKENLLMVGLVKHMQCDSDPVLSTDTIWSGESFGLERATHWSWSRYALAAMGADRDTDSAPVCTAPVIMLASLGFSVDASCILM